MSVRVLTALPVYNEERHVAEVLAQVVRYSGDVLVVDDGSSDNTVGEVEKFSGVRVISHERNRGYGAGIRTAFEAALAGKYDVLVTIDCDGQHEPALIPEIASALGDEWDLVSGSRYLKKHEGDSLPPVERRRVNQIITESLNTRLGLNLTDGFCGFKAYRVPALRELQITDLGYAMPLQVWLQAVCAGWRITEFPVPLVYLEEERSFGGALDDTEVRLAHYREVLNKEFARLAREKGWTPPGDLANCCHECAPENSPA
jgi:glycosyltransferase involved in cell wall biosynthesis